MKIIDLRSDTVTQPSPAMRDAMCQAIVGDDVMSEDPTVNQLEAYAAELLGVEAALFVTSGTQGNLLSVLAHCQRGDEYIAGRQSHLQYWEAGNASVLGGVFACALDVEEDGTLDLTQVKNAIKPDDPHFARTQLLVLENTHNGKVLPLNYLKEAKMLASAHQLNTHLDGARLFNAAMALNVPAKEIAQYFDSVTFCLSKGLGAPIGSMICGNKPFIAKARRLRKLVGGGMRQAGIIAAAGLFALSHHIPRLIEDHDNAAYLAKNLSQLPAWAGKIVHNTNMVFIENKAVGTKNMADFFASYGIKLWDENPLRLVTHLDVNRQDMNTVIAAFKAFE